MDELDPAIESVHDFEVKNEPTSFDKILPEPPVQLSVESKRIVYQTRAGTTKVIQLNKKNKYHEIILKACALSVQSDWCSMLKNVSKPAYFDRIRQFFDWINDSDYQTTSKTRYAVLKDFEVHQMNDCGMKHSSLNSINKMLREGMNCSLITKEEYDYLQILISLSKPVIKPVSDPVTLSRWFDLSWLRDILGEAMYLQLESPRLLIKSFRVTVATTLLWLLEQRRDWRQFPVIQFDSSYSVWYNDWNRLLLKSLGKFNDRGEPEDELNQLLIYDLVLESAQAAMKSQLGECGTKDLPKKVNLKNKKNPPWKKPVFFHPDNQTQYSEVEELLCAWLVACDAVQPTDILKLKASNFAREYNRHGRLIAMECTYYKGRSGEFKQPDILMGSDSWTRALEAYINGLSEPSLFKTRVATQFRFPNLNNKSTALSFLYTIWNMPGFKKQLNYELQRAEVTPLFPRAMLALENGTEHYAQFKMRTGKTVGEYRKLLLRPLPVNLFTFTHIKTTAVHAKSDVYREADLVNHNSHTSLTEKNSYLTDANKDWLNQAGRITRLVIHDLQNVVYQPSIKAIGQAVIDLDLRTRVIDTAQSDDITIHSLRSNAFEENHEGEILVSDTEDAALYFIHYITQAEEFLPKLVEVRPDWVERTLIVNVEWMTRTLTRMRKATIARKNYTKLESHLPMLFEHLLETME